MLSEAEIEALKARPENACDRVAARWVTLRPQHGKRGWFIGPCPMHSRDPSARDSTAFECNSEGWVCAACADGGDVIALVMRHDGVDFRAAVEQLGGARAVDPAEARRAEEARAARQAAHEETASHYRETERRRAWDILQRGRPIAGTDGERYLREARGLDLPADVRLRFDAHARYYVPEAKGRARHVYTGPAVLALVQRAGRFAGVHQTWIDLARPNGKASIVDPATGETLPAKKVRGSVRGGHIDLAGCRDAARLIMGEGIETTGAVWSALRRAGRDVSRIAFWASVSLGNLGGRADGSVAHPTLRTQGERPRARRVPGPLPDLATDAIVIPAAITDMTLLADADGDRFGVMMALQRAARRYGTAGRVVRAVWPDDGCDFNDMVKDGPRGAVGIA